MAKRIRIFKSSLKLFKLNRRNLTRIDNTNVILSRRFVRNMSDINNADRKFNRNTLSFHKILIR